MTHEKARRPWNLGRLLTHNIVVVLLFSLTLWGCEFKYSVDGKAVNHQKDPHESLPGKPAVGGKPGVVQSRVRLMTYNIQYLSSDVVKQGNRLAKLQTMIRDISPTVVAVQEVADRAAMETVFPRSDWQVVIDDDSHDRQDVAIAVRRPWKITNIPDDLDADDENFLCEGARNDVYFPNRRDGLFVNVTAPNGSTPFTVVSIHAKARVGGRAKTQPRREGAARLLVSALQGELKGRRVAIMGDFNDAPDDASLNILESGDFDAVAGDNGQSALMVNLGQPLWDKNMITEGASADHLVKATGMINIVFPQAKKRNAQGRGRDTNTGPIMFDQILVNRKFAGAVIPGSISIYVKPIALEGVGTNRASDHLPVMVDLDTSKF